MAETQEEQIENNRKLWSLGYPWADSVLAIQDLTQGIEGPIDSEGNAIGTPPPMEKLEWNNPARMEMVRLFQLMMREDLEKNALELLRRSAVADGIVGKATLATFNQPRCGCPDYAAPKAPGHDEAEAIGQGPWKQCHGVGQFHASHWRFTNAPPSHLNGPFNGERTIFQEALRRTRESYREIGLLCYFSGPGTGDLFLPPNESVVQSNASFVNSSQGWIGLAIVGNNSMSCSSNPIWERFLASFAQSESAEAKAHVWHLLLAHEKGHNCGLGHTSGGIMNPSLNRSASGRWVGDVAENWMKGRFGGEKVPIPGPDPDPDPDDGGIDWAVVIAFIIKVLVELFKKPVKTMRAILKAMKENEKNE